MLEYKPELSASSPSKPETPRSPLSGMQSRPSFVYAVQKQPMDLSTSFTKLHFSQDGLNVNGYHAENSMKILTEAGLTSHPKYWTNAEVLGWLESNDFIGAITYFEVNNLDGEHLIGLYMYVFLTLRDSSTQLWT